MSSRTGRFQSRPERYLFVRIWQVAVIASCHQTFWIFVLTIPVKRTPFKPCRSSSPDFSGGCRKRPCGCCSPRLPWQHSDSERMHIRISCHCLSAKLRQRASFIVQRIERHLPQNALFVCTAPVQRHWRCILYPRIFLCRSRYPRLADHRARVYMSRCTAKFVLCTGSTMNHVLY